MSQAVALRRGVCQGADVRYDQTADR